MGPDCRKLGESPPRAAGSDRKVWAFLPGSMGIKRSVRYQALGNVKIHERFMVVAIEFIVSILHTADLARHKLFKQRPARRAERPVFLALVMFSVWLSTAPAFDLHAVLTPASAVMVNNLMFFVEAGFKVGDFLCEGGDLRTELCVLLLRVDQCGL